jgi:hypothetical protein
MERRRGRRFRLEAQRQPIFWTLFLAGALLAALAPAAAVTISKVNAVNSFSRSDNQRVFIYGKPPLVVASALSASSKIYGNNTAAPYPYSTSTNTLVKFASPTTGALNTGEYATNTISTVNPDAGLSVSYWRWFTSGTSLGSVPDPSIYRRKGISGFNSRGQAWVSLDYTCANTSRVSNVTDEQFQGAQPRPIAVLVNPDFSVGLRLEGQTRQQEVDREQFFSVTSLNKVNPNSSGELAASDALVRNASNDPAPGGALGACWVDLNNGLSAAGPSSTTNPVEPRVVDPNDPTLIPTAAQPVTAVVLASTPGSGVDPMDPNSATPPRIASADRNLTEVTLHPGATITFRVRVLLGAAHILADPGASFKFLFLLRARESSVTPGLQTTRTLVAAVAEYPEPLNICSPVTNPAAGTFGPRDRQEWAHLVSLYNRALRLKQLPAGP